MIRLFDCKLIWGRVKHAAHHAVRPRRPHRIGRARRWRRVAGAATSKPAIVGFTCVVVGGTGGWLAGGAPGWSALPPVERPAPLSHYWPPEAIAALPPGTILPPEYALPPVEILNTPLPVVPIEIAGPPRLLPDVPAETPRPIPEPGSLALLLPVLAAFAAWRKRA